MAAGRNNRVTVSQVDALNPILADYVRDHALADRYRTSTTPPLEHLLQQPQHPL